jgi:hypothetical protein
LESPLGREPTPLVKPLRKPLLDRRRHEVEGDKHVHRIPRHLLPRRIGPPHPIVEPGSQIGRRVAFPGFAELAGFFDDELEIRGVLSNAPGVFQSTFPCGAHIVEKDLLCDGIRLAGGLLGGRGVARQAAPSDRQPDSSRTEEQPADFLE